MLPPDTLFYRYGKRLVAVRQRADLNEDVIAFSSFNKTFTREPKLYTEMILDKNDLLSSISEEEFCHFLEQVGGKIEDLAQLLDEGNTKKKANQENDIDYTQFIGILPVEQDAIEFTRELRE